MRMSPFAPPRAVTRFTDSETFVLARAAGALEALGEERHKQSEGQAGLTDGDKVQFRQFAKQYREDAATLRRLIGI